MVHYYRFIKRDSASTFLLFVQRKTYLRKSIKVTLNTWPFDTYYLGIEYYNPLSLSDEPEEGLVCGSSQI